jgi:hypothetical protein
MSQTDPILAFIAANPGCTAVEAGTTPVDMIRREKAGQVIRVGLRKTGTRGRPPVEWALTGAEVEIEPRVAEATERAKQRVADHRQYEKDYARLSAIRLTHGLFSDEAKEARLNHKEKWPTPPVLPTEADYAAAGAATVGAEV